MISVIVTLLTTAIGAFIGTMYGSKKLYEFQQSGKIATRKTAIKAVEILKNTQVNHIIMQATISIHL